MSRAFEALERLQQDQELFCVPAVTKDAPGHSRPPSGKASIPEASASEEILKLVQCVFLATNGDGHRPDPRRVVFCGVDEAHGSNRLCARIGRSLAEQVHTQVCVVDANLRVPSPNPLFDLSQSDSSFQSESGITQKLCRRVTDNLWLVSRDSVPANGGAPTLDDVQLWIRDLEDAFAHVVISAPPIGLFSDAALLGQMADGIVLVLEANSTRRAAARKAKQSLQEANVRLLGVVLNGRTYPIPGTIYRRL